MKPLIHHETDGNKPILPITHGQTPSSDMIIVVNKGRHTCMEFLKMFTGSVQKTITLPNSSVDVVLVRRKDFAIHVAVSIQFLYSQLQPML